MATCKRKVAQLNELMDFLPFGLVQPQTFTGMVVFTFLQSEHKVECIKCIDMRNGIEIRDSIIEDDSAIHVAVTISDFLYMYSGEACASEIASMCLKNRIKVHWTKYGALQSFANAFDFSSEKWDDFYITRPKEEVLCTCHTCKGDNSFRDNSDLKWELVCHTVLHIQSTPKPEDWQVIQPEMYSFTSVDAFEPVQPIQQEEDWYNTLIQPGLWTNKIKQSLTNAHDFAINCLVED